MLFSLVHSMCCPRGTSSKAVLVESCIHKISFYVPYLLVLDSYHRVNIEKSLYQ